MLNPDEILARRREYPCCTLSFLHAAILAWDRGETHCGDENYEKALYMLWASRIMCSTPIESDEHPGCTTIEEATAWASYADCLCSPCSCEEEEVDCTIEIDYTVLEGLPFSDLPPSPSVDDSYYILSGTNVGTIATVGSISYVFTAIPDDSIVFASTTNTYYTNIGNGPGLLFPPPLLTLVSGDVWLYASSNAGTATDRPIQLQGYSDTNGWFNIAYPTTEDELPQQVSITGLGITDVRFVYLLEDGECPEYSGDGTFVPPIVPPGPCDIISDYSAVETVDASQQGLVGPGTFFIVSDNFSMGNTWASHVGELVLTGVLTTDVFTVVEDYQTVYDLTNELNWWMTPGGPSPLFIPYTAALVTGGYLLESDYPDASASAFRLVTVEAQIGGVWTLMWAGYEYDLPQTVPLLGPITAIRTNYIYPNGCVYTVNGTVDPDTTIVTDTDCTEVIYNNPGYRYPLSAGAPFSSFLIQAPPGQQASLTFLQGQMAANVVIRAYSGTDNTGAPIPTLTGYFADLPGASGSSTGENLYLEVDAPQAMTDDLLTWLWQVSCVTGAVSPAATAVATDDCSSYEFSLDVDITFLGDATSVGLSYSVDGEAPTVISGITSTGVQTIGPFPYESEVLVIIIHEQDPLANLWVGVFTNADTCSYLNNPCLPAGANKIDALGDLADLPATVPSPGFAFLVVSDVTGIGTWPVGELLSGASMGDPWSPISYTPGIQTAITPPEYWFSQGPGIQPYPLFPVQELTPSGSTPNNWLLYTPAIVNYGIPTNTPLIIEVRNGLGPWVQAWPASGVGSLQQTNTPLPISIVQPFTQARGIYNPETCGLISGVNINEMP